MADASVETAVVGRCLVAAVSGDMNHQSESRLRTRFKELASRGHRFIVLDLSQVTFCDSAGLNLPLTAWRQSQDIDGALVLACVPQHLRRDLATTCADQILRVFDTATEAAAAIG